MSKRQPLIVEFIVTGTPEECLAGQLKALRILLSGEKPAAERVAVGEEG